MTTNIIEFPARSVREWIMVERTIREAPKQAGDECQGDVGEN